MSDTKKCTRCSKVLPVARFAIRRQATDSKPAQWQPACRACTARIDRARREMRQRNKGTVLAESKVYLPVGPFSELVSREVVEHGEEGAAIRFGVSPRVLWRIRHHEYPTIELDLVDRMLCAADMPGVLREMYPAIYEFTEQVAA